MALLVALDIARRALLAQESALAVTGHNIANVDTPGYTRQAPDFESERGVIGPSGLLLGNGVRLDSVGQVIDPLLARRRLAAETDQGEQDVRRDQLAGLSATLNDLSKPSLSGAVDGFFDAADFLARNPQGLAERQSLLGSATAVVTELNRRGTSVANLQRAADDQLVFVANQVNDDLTKIATLNRDIVNGESTGQTANDLRDQRQNVLNDLAGKLAIHTVTDARGSVTVSSAAGPTLVADGDVIHGVGVQAGAVGLDGRVLHDLGLSTPNGAFLTVPEVFTHGQVGALIGVRDGTLVTAATNLDAVAGALRDAVNAIQTDPAARDLDGNATTAAPLFAGAGARDLTVAISDPRLIGAALSSQPNDNQNALRLADLRTAPPLSVAPASVAAIAVGNQPLSQYLAAELARVGEDAVSANDAAASSELVTQQLETERATLSGVNLNEELTNLIKYQRSFQAAAQIINVSNTVLDELLRVV